MAPDPERGRCPRPRGAWFFPKAGEPKLVKEALRWRDDVEDLWPCPFPRPGCPIIRQLYGGHRSNTSFPDLNSMEGAIVADLRHPSCPICCCSPSTTRPSSPRSSSTCLVAGRKWIVRTDGDHGIVGGQPQSLLRRCPGVPRQPHPHPRSSSTTAFADIVILGGDPPSSRSWPGIAPQKASNAGDGVRCVSSTSPLLRQASPSLIRVEAGKPRLRFDRQGDHLRGSCSLTSVRAPSWRRSAPPHWTDAGEPGEYPACNMLHGTPTAEAPDGAEGDGTWIQRSRGETASALALSRGAEVVQAVRKVTQENLRPHGVGRVGGSMPPATSALLEFPASWR